MNTFRQIYLSHINQVYPPLAPDDGTPLMEIVTAEQRLNTALPDALRTFYLVAGRRSDITSSHNRLLPSQDIYIADDVAVFLAENQWVMLWGIRVQDCSLTNPIVYVTENTSNPQWQPIGDTTSLFLISTIYWQAVLGGLPYIGITGPQPDDPRLLLQDFIQVPSNASAQPSRIYVSDGKVVCIIEADGGYEMYAGGRTKDDFIALDKLLNVDWYYSTLDDELAE